MKRKLDITVIDDSKDFLEALILSLQENFIIHPFTSPEDGLDYISSNDTEALLLDLHLPGRDGFQVYQDVKRAKSSLPVIFLTGDINIENKIKGLDFGADDFINKPVQAEELIARIKNRIASRKKLGRENKIISFEDLTVDIDGNLITLKNKNIQLTPKEYQLLLMLLQNPNKVIHKSDIIQALWKDVHVEVNNLDTHFSNLRRKLRPFSNHIKTLKNLGYVFRI